MLDKLTYAGREENLEDLAGKPRFSFVKGAIEDAQAVGDAIAACSPDALVNFAAETHVDRSIAEPDAFVKTHALGTYVLLEAAREHELRYLQVSTDEVYGSIEQGTFTEESPLRPSSPYSATKTGADLLVESYFHTYDLPINICRGSNNYGPYQYPEKLIPLMVLNALHGEHLPVYGDGMQVRNWIHASDFARAIGHVLEHGVHGEVYNAGGPDEEANITVVKRIIELTGAQESQIEHVTDRPGHDRRYSLSSEKVRGPGLDASGAFRGGASSRRSAGTGRTRGGGSRSARATTAPTTSASTGAHCRDEIFHCEPSFWKATVVIRFLPATVPLTFAVALVPLT